MTRAEYRALAELRYQIRSFLAFSESRARAAGVEPRQHQLLLAIAGLPRDQTPTISVLAERLGIRHHSAVELASRAERARLVERERSEEDQRVVTLAVTKRGNQVLEKLSAEHRAELRRSAPALARVLRAIVRGKP